VRMVATDIDGTIVRRDGSVSARTAAAFAACRDAGVDVVLVTGRPPRWLEPVLLSTGRVGTAVCGNGALVYDVVTERVLRSRTLDAAGTLAAAAALREALVAPAFAVETLSGFRREAAYLTRWDTGVERDVGPLEELVADEPGVVKLLVRDEGQHADTMLGRARRVLGDTAVPTHSNVRDCLVEVSAAGVSKAATLAELAAERGYGAQDVVAFGDMPNDAEMLAWAGRGYAVADGHPDVVRGATAVAPPCEEDGVARVVEALLAGREPGPACARTP
jgi:hydroxymethylpyrimidine pyrophosphatase-like HAD family hydrolase